MNHDSLTWYLLPVAAAVSLVWCATRYEMPAKILFKAAAMYIKILAGMGIILVLLMFLSNRL